MALRTDTLVQILLWGIVGLVYALLAAQANGQTPGQWGYCDTLSPAAAGGAVAPREIDGVLGFVACKRTEQDAALDLRFNGSGLIGARVFHADGYGSEAYVEAPAPGGLTERTVFLPFDSHRGRGAGTIYAWASWRDDAGTEVSSRERDREVQYPVYFAQAEGPPDPPTIEFTLPTTINEGAFAIANYAGLALTRCWITVGLSSAAGFEVAVPIDQGPVVDVDVTLPPEAAGGTAFFVPRCENAYGDSVAGTQLQFDVPVPDPEGPPDAPSIRFKVTA